MDLYLGCKKIDKIRDGIQMYMVETKTFVSNINQNEDANIVLLNGQPILFSLSIKDVYLF